MLLTTLAFALPNFMQTDSITEADVLNEGTLVEANIHFNGAAGGTINGITFGNDGTAPNGFNNALSGWCSTCPAPFDVMLDDLYWQGAGTSPSIVLDGLVTGETYRMQILMGNTTNSTGYTTTLQFQGDSLTMTTWGAAQPAMVTIEFEASATTESVVFPPTSVTNNRAVFNAYTLHQVDLSSDAEIATDFGEAETVIDASHAKARLRPNNIVPLLENLQAVADGGSCVTTGSWAGTYNQGDFSGVTSDGGVLDGTYAAHEVSGTLDASTVGGTYTWTSGKKYIADVDGTEFGVGRFIRVAGRNGVFVGTHETTCDGASTFDSTFDGNLD